MNPISGPTMAATEAALRGLSVRADVRADNIANINTPGFVAGAVDFESSIAAALRDGRMEADEAAAAVTVARNLPGPNQNLVSPDGEMVGLLKDGLLRSAMVQAYNFKVNAFRTAIGTR